MRKVRNQVAAPHTGSTADNRFDSNVAVQRTVLFWVAGAAWRKRLSRILTVVVESCCKISVLVSAPHRVFSVESRKEVHHVSSPDQIQ